MFSAKKNPSHLDFAEKGSKTNILKAYSSVARGLQNTFRNRSENDLQKKHFVNF